MSGLLIHTTVLRIPTHQKEGKGVERQTEGMVDCTVQPNFWISQAIPNVSPRESFVLCRITIIFQTSVDGSSLVIRNESCFRRPVRDVPPAKRRENAGGKSFDDKDPALYRATSANYSRRFPGDVLLLTQPAYPPTPFMKLIPYAKMPPKAPAREAMAKKSEIRNCLSDLLYHMLK